LGLFFVYTYNEISKSKESIFERIEKHEINQMAYVLQNMQQQILAHAKEHEFQDLATFFEDKEHTTQYEEMLSMMLTSDVKYSYILYRDATQKFRFLLDASKTDKASFNQKFDVNAPEYELAYSTKKPQLIKQQNVENLYLTYLHPIIKDGEVVALFNIDFTTDIKAIILESIKPLETLFTLLTLFIVIFMAMTLMQIFHYFITKRKIFTDPLTKTFNRNYLEEIGSVLNLENYSLAMLDLDNLKSSTTPTDIKRGTMFSHMQVKSSKTLSETMTSWCVMAERSFCFLSTTATTQNEISVRGLEVTSPKRSLFMMGMRFL